MKVRRVIEYEGDPEWIERTLKKSIGGGIQKEVRFVKGRVTCGVIREVSREVIEEDGAITSGHPKIVGGATNAEDRKGDWKCNITPIDDDEDPAKASTDR